MADPFLLAHHAGPLVFDLSGKLIPVSIRDQMLRGRLFVDRAIEERLIAPGPNTGLLVVGGGACGAAAAMHAAAAGVHATLVESSPTLFRVQAGCPTRWVDPTQYDWPLDHWGAGIHPEAGLPMPLPWTAGPADRLASVWRAQLSMAMARHGPLLLDVRVRSRATIPFAPGAASAMATITTPTGAFNRQFGAVLVTIGFGLEDTTAPPNYRGFAFWEPDPFQTPNVGVTRTASPRVLISGAGDGAIQDFIRILSGLDSVEAFMRACAIPPGVAAALKDIDRTTAASFHWGATSRHDHPIHVQLDADCRAQAKAALADPVVGPNLGRALTRPIDLRLIHRCDHLTPYYLLNRFAALLVDEYRVGRGDAPLIAPHESVAEVRSLGTHACTSAATCHGEEHDVMVQPWPDCRVTPAPSPVSAGTFHVIVIRHGIRPAALPFAGLTPLAQPRQVLPSYLL